MSQATVTNYYYTRKRLKDNVEGVKALKETQSNLEGALKSRKAIPSSQIDQCFEAEKDHGITPPVQLPASVSTAKPRAVTKKNPARSKASKTTKGTKKSNTTQTTVTKFYKSVNSSSADVSEPSSTKELNHLKDEEKTDNTISVPEGMIKDKCVVQHETTALSANFEPVLEVPCKKSIKSRNLKTLQDEKVTPNLESMRSNIKSKNSKTLQDEKVVPNVESMKSNSKSKNLKTLQEEKAVTNVKSNSKSKNLKTLQDEKVVSNVESMKSNSKSKNSKTLQEEKVVSNVESMESNITRSPKRTLPIPGELTPSKKKAHMSSEKESFSRVITPDKTKQAHACRKLDMSFPTSPSKVTSSLHSPVKNQVSSPRKVLSPKEKLNALIDQSRSKLLLTPNLEGLRKSLESFTKKTSMLKEYQSNPYKITSSITPTKSKCNSPVLPSSPAHERFSYLAAPETSTLILPFKFRLLADMFRSMDTVISILHNRKEKITFDKVQDGVKKMMKRNFLKTHVGQIATVLPSAYSFTIEKCNFMNKKADSKDYQLIITPVLTAEDQKNKKSKSVAFQPMHPQCLIDRRSDFNEALLQITKKHHQDFLNKLKFPLVPEEDLKRWHPKFAVDSVPDILSAHLPEPQESKIYTAKDVLNKVKGSFRNKVEKALQSVADESKKDVTLELKDISSSKPETSKTALKGICTDLLEKIRARESAKLLETMTRTPDETKRLAMMERLPKIIHILWHFFIAERKATVPIDVAIEKIIHSFNSLSTPDDVKDHLKLITETFPGWLSFIQITKGMYIQIDKKRNINEMLDKFPH